MSISVTCQACAATFRISDALYEKRFAGRTAKLRCKKCQAVIDVDGTKGPDSNPATELEWDLEAPPKVATPPQVVSASAPKAVSAPPPPKAVSTPPPKAVSTPPPKAVSVPPPKAVSVPKVEPPRPKEERTSSTPSLRAVTIAIDVTRDAAVTAAPEPSTVLEPQSTPEPEPVASITAEDTQAATDSPASAREPEPSASAEEKPSLPEPASVTPDAADLTPEPVAAAPVPPRRSVAPFVAGIAALAAAAGFLLYDQGSAPAQSPEASVAAAHVAEPSPVEPAAPERAAAEPAAPAEPLEPRAEPSAPPVDPPAPAADPSEKPAHDEQALGFALRWGMARAEACHKGGRAGGTTRVTVRFAPEGRVREVVIDNETIASAPVGRCIEAYLKAMLLPPFEGPELEVVRELTLR